MLTNNDEVGFNEVEAMAGRKRVGQFSVYALLKIQNHILKNEKHNRLNNIKNRVYTLVVRFKYFSMSTL